MKKLWPLIAFYYVWQPILKLIFGVGVVMLILKILFFSYHEGLTFALGLGSLAFLFIIPFCSGSSALRILISNPHTAMVPGLRLYAGIAHLLIAIVTSIYVYISFNIFSGETWSPLIMAGTFTGLSLFALFMQLVLPSRYFIPLISFSPFVFIMLIVGFQDIVSALVRDSRFIIAAFLVSLAGWAYGLYQLKTRNNFKPPSKFLTDTEAWATYDGGIFTHMAIGRSRTAEGTLLLGYPDNMTGIVLRVAYYFIVTPMITTFGMILVGIADAWDIPVREIVFNIFLPISLFSAVFCIFMHGELVARARLVWLRYGTDRLHQWRLVDHYCLKFLSVYFICAVLVAAISLLFSAIPAHYLVHYLVIIASNCLFNLYFSLFVRVKGLSPVILVLVVIVNVIALFTGIKYALGAAPDYTALVSLEILLLVLGLACRAAVKLSFTDIDWKLVSLKTQGKYVLTQHQGGSHV